MVLLAKADWLHPSAAFFYRRQFVVALKLWGKSSKYRKTLSVRFSITLQYLKNYYNTLMLICCSFSADPKQSTLVRKRMVQSSEAVDEVAVEQQRLRAAHMELLASNFNLSGISVARPASTVAAARKEGWSSTRQVQILLY